MLNADYQFEGELGRKIKITMDKTRPKNIILSITDERGNIITGSFNSEELQRGINTILKIQYTLND